MAVKKIPTKEDKKWFADIRALGCIVCGTHQDLQIHHITGAGMGLRSNHQDSICLCMKHHLTGGPGVAVHAGVKTWEKNYGTQRELLEQTLAALAASDIPG